MSDKQRTGEKAGREGGGGPPPEPEPDRDIFVVLLALRTATKMTSMMLNAAEKGQEMVEGASRYVSITVESIMPDPFSRWLTRFRQMTYFQWFLLAVMGLFLAVITPPALILLGLFSAVALPVAAVTSPFWGPVAVVFLALTFPLWSPALAGLAIFQWAGRMAGKVKEGVTKLEGHLPKPARGVIGWFRGMSRAKQVLALFALAAATVLGIGALLVVGTPVVVIGGGLMLFFSPVILLTSPLWIPVVLFFLAVAAVVLGGAGFLVAMAVSAYWLYRYYRGPMPLGGESVFKLQRKMGGMLDRTRQTIAGKAV
ncbi:hypothetical protein CBR_g32311 [Chara braunii]|uniref:Oleosin n=1 Tax=Chara braunii TaxID=69332 RepID=A0A388JNE3_CHABU|nr:hypothetical protein CBR_g32311 [Chara braunii]|eukprot:GBG59298.1 hypothetical protein CBR_g32311 [Chara braunii]